MYVDLGKIISDGRIYSTFFLTLKHNILKGKYINF